MQSGTVTLRCQADLYGGLSVRQASLVGRSRATLDNTARSGKGLLDGQRRGVENDRIIGHSQRRVGPS
jgi:hypothetical protein